MSAAHVAAKIAMVALQAGTLYCLSRLLFVWVLQSLATGGHGGGWAVKVLRLPGNIVHEVSHALGYLLCGYRVQRLQFCVSDPKGRGMCRPGKPWSPVSFPWLATAAAALLPLVTGALVLRGVAEVLDIPFTQDDRDPGEPAPVTFWNTIWLTLQMLDYRDWRTWLFLYAGFSIGAELAPSDVDLKRSLVPVGALGAGLAAFTLYVGGLHPTSALWRWSSVALAEGMAALSSVLVFGIIATSLLIALTAGPAMLWRGIRRILAPHPRPRSSA